MLAIIRDVTERKRLLEERLAYLAYHDGLTGLANRAAFLERLEGAIARGDREGSGVAILYLDLDRFKEVNDAFGHDVGDEFCAMLEGVADAEEAENVAARVAKQLVGPYSVGGHEVPGLEASVGVAVRPPGVRSSAGQLLREADLAMYQTKRHAR